MVRKVLKTSISYNKQIGGGGICSKQAIIELNNLKGKKYIFTKMVDEIVDDLIYNVCVYEVQFEFIDAMYTCMDIINILQINDAIKSDILSDENKEAIKIFCNQLLYTYYNYIDTNRFIYIVYENDTYKLHKRFTLRENKAFYLKDIAQIKTELRTILSIPTIYIGCVQIPIDFLDEKRKILPGKDYETLLDYVD